MLSGITFNSVDLTALTGINFNRLDISNTPKKELSILKIARADGVKLVNADLAEKLIVLEGFISAATPGDFETARDLLLKNLRAEEATLRILQGDRERDYTATAEGVIVSEDNGGFGVFTIKFVCSDPLGYETNATTDLAASSNTAASVTKTFTAIGGSYKAQPVIRVNISAISGGTNKYIKLTNPANSQYIKITRTWGAGDALEVDVANKTVTVNGTAVDYTGVFPEFDPGATQLTYEDDFTTSRTVLISMSHKNRYI